MFFRLFLVPRLGACCRHILDVGRVTRCGSSPLGDEVDRAIHLGREMSACYDTMSEGYRLECVEGVGHPGLLLGFACSDMLGYHDVPRCPVVALVRDHAFRGFHFGQRTEPAKLQISAPVHMIHDLQVTRWSESVRSVVAGGGGGLAFGVAFPGGSSAGKGAFKALRGTTLGYRRGPAQQLVGRALASADQELFRARWYSARIRQEQTCQLLGWHYWPSETTSELYAVPRLPPWG